MSFVAVPRQNFETFQADGPWQSGARGWSRAPVPGWGMNPNQTLPRFQATAGCGCSGMGDTTAPTPPAALPPAPAPALPVEASTSSPAAIVVLGAVFVAAAWAGMKFLRH